MKEALIFTAGLSGLKAYSRRTPKEHADRLMREFHSRILEAKPPALHHSDTKGSALLFFREGDGPSLDVLQKWAADMLKSFQEAVQDYEDKRICPCAACRDLPSVSLSFAVYHGPVGFIRIIESTKLHGEALERTLAGLEKGGGGMGRMNFVAGFPQAADHIGLSTQTFSPQKLGGSSQHSPATLSNQVVLNADWGDAFEMISNLALRGEWRPGLKAVDCEKSLLNRAGLRHVQVSPTGRVGVETIAVGVGKNQCGFGERISGGPGGTDWVLHYLLEEKGRQLDFRMEAHLPKVSILQKPAQARFKRKIRRELEDATKRLAAIFV